MKKYKKGIKDPWDGIKQSNTDMDYIYIDRLSPRRRRKIRTFKKMVRNSPNLMKNIDTHIQGVQ